MVAFVSDHWVQIGAFCFGAVHAFIALERWWYDRSQRPEKVKAMKDRRPGI